MHPKSSTGKHTKAKAIRQHSRVQQNKSQQCKSQHATTTMLQSRKLHKGTKYGQFRYAIKELRVQEQPESVPPELWLSPLPAAAALARTSRCAPCTARWPMPRHAGKDTHQGVLVPSKKLRNLKPRKDSGRRRPGTVPGRLPEKHAQIFKPKAGGIISFKASQNRPHTCPLAAGLLNTTSSDCGASCTKKGRARHGLGCGDPGPTTTASR